MFEHKQTSMRFQSAQHRAWGRDPDFDLVSKLVFAAGRGQLEKVVRLARNVTGTDVKLQILQLVAENADFMTVWVLAKVMSMISSIKHTGRE